MHHMSNVDVHAWVERQQRVQIGVNLLEKARYLQRVEFTQTELSNAPVSNVARLI
jgi:hypothetical protein